VEVTGSNPVSPITKHRNMSSYFTATNNRYQYYTPPESSEWCLRKLLEFYGNNLNSMTLLEPCVGKGSFVVSAQKVGLKSPWVTMDLYPSPDFAPDYTADFRKKIPGFNPDSVDLVVTNPPFGDACSTAKAMVKHAVSTYGQAAMLLPIGCRRPSFLDKMPRDCELVFDYDVPVEDFILPDGSIRQVKTIFQLWVKQEGFMRELLQETEPLSEHYSLQYEGTPTDAHELGMCCWGSVGKTYSPREKSYAKQCFWTFHTDVAKKAFESIDWGSYGKEWSNSVITINSRDIYTEMNRTIRALCDSSQSGTPTP
jgi:hypothetical protein